MKAVVHVPILLGSSSSWGDETERREISTVARRIACQEPHTGDRGVRPDVEIGKRGAFLAASSSISQKAFPSQEGGLPGQRAAFEQLRRQRFLQVLDTRKADRDLRVDDRVDRENRLVGSAGERFSGPGKPARILRQDVQEDIAVHQNLAPIHLRVSARISSVLIRTVPRPLRWATRVLPRAAAPRAFLIRAVFPSISNSTPVFGCKPSFCRILWGIVTCPLDVIRMPPPVRFLPVLLLHTRPNASRGERETGRSAISLPPEKRRSVRTVPLPPGGFGEPHVPIKGASRVSIRRLMAPTVPSWNQLEEPIRDMKAQRAAAA